MAGWRPVLDCHGVIRKGCSPWFMVELTPETAPWAFRNWLPFRAIMALELFTVLLMVMALEEPMPQEPPQARSQRKVVLSVFSDSEGGTHVLAKGASGAFPLCLVTMELAVQLEARGAPLEAEWAPRTVNEEADALTNGDTSGFSDALRVDVYVSALDFKVLPRLQDEAASTTRSWPPSGAVAGTTRRPGLRRGGPARSCGTPTRGR